MRSVLALLFFMGVLIYPQEKWTAPTSASKIKNPIALTNKIIAKGKKTYTKICQTCHGTNGLGDGAAAKDLNPKPASFKDSTVQAQTDGALFWKISEGKGAMSSYKNLLTTDHRWQLVHYLRTFKVK